MLPPDGDEVAAETTAADETGVALEEDPGQRRIGPSNAHDKGQKEGEDATGSARPHSPQPRPRPRPQSLHLPPPPLAHAVAGLDRTEVEALESDHGIGLGSLVVTSDRDEEDDYGSTGYRDSTAAAEDRRASSSLHQQREEDSEATEERTKTPTKNSALARSWPLSLASRRRRRPGAEAVRGNGSIGSSGRGGPSRTMQDKVDAGKAAAVRRSANDRPPSTLLSSSSKSLSGQERKRSGTARVEMSPCSSPSTTGDYNSPCNETEEEVEGQRRAVIAARARRKMASSSKRANRRSLGSTPQATASSSSSSLSSSSDGEETDAARRSVPGAEAVSGPGGAGAGADADDDRRPSDSDEECDPVALPVPDDDEEDRDRHHLPVFGASLAPSETGATAGSSPHGSPGPTPGMTTATQTSTMLPPVYEAQPLSERYVDKEKGRPASPRDRRRRRKWIVACCLLAVVAAAAIGLAVGLAAGRRPSDDGAATATATPGANATTAADPEKEEQREEAKETATTTSSPSFRPTTTPTASSPTSLRPTTSSPSTSAPTTLSPTLSPTRPPRPEAIRSLLLPHSGADVLDDPTTAQGRAYRFVVDADTLQLDPFDEPRRVVQRYALAAFYYATDGWSWRFQSNFLEDVHECQWNMEWEDSFGYKYDAGVFCGGTGGDPDAVDEIVLEYNTMRGTLPPELGLLTDLVSIRLGYNYDLSGPLPPALGDLSNLEALDLEENSFAGPVPASLGRLGKLRALNLNRNGLSGQLPAALGNLTSLTVLDVSENRLDGTIPSDLCAGITSTVEFRLNDNELVGPLPESLGRMTNARTVRLERNKLNGTVPASIGDLEKLETLHLWNNRLSGTVPDVFKGQFSELVDVRLHGNPSLRGTVNFCDLPVVANDCSGRLYADCRQTTTTDNPDDGAAAGDTDVTIVECPCCSVCCDGEGGCQSAGRTCE